jgi:hypothetical protein
MIEREQQAVAHTTAIPLPLPRSLVINETLLARLILVLALAAGAFLRIWQINAMGYNTDEAVYAGQAAAIAGVEGLKEIFPVFRAHPLLFQFGLSIIYHFNFNDLWGRLLAAAIGLGTIYLSYRLGRLMYSELAGALAAAFMALMPYHVLVSRQVLLDGPMTFFATLALLLLAKFGRSGRGVWLAASGAAMGLTFLSKETGIVLVGAIYAFLALAPELRVRLRTLLLSTAVMALVIAPFPLTLMLSGGSSTGRNYLIWQLFRRPNHDWPFYFTDALPAIGWLVIIAALGGLLLLRRSHSWREKLLIAWIVIPLVFFQLWPVKGFQYLLPIAPALAVLAARTLALWVPVLSLPQIQSGVPMRWLAWLAAAGIALSLVLASVQVIQPARSAQFLAGTGGVPGGREMGIWISENVPERAEILTLGPSMANIIQFYGFRKAYGLAVSPNPLQRNPSYRPILNPDLHIRRSDLQYLVWDSFSAARSQFFSDKLMSYVNKYNGRAIHTETIQITQPDGSTVTKPVIILFEVHP